MPRTLKLKLHWSGVAQEADDVVGGHFGVGGGLAEPPVIIAGLAPKVGADGKDCNSEVRCPILVRDEDVAWRQ